MTSFSTVRETAYGLSLTDPMLTGRPRISVSFLTATSFAVKGRIRKPSRV